MQFLINNEVYDGFNEEMLSSLNYDKEHNVLCLYFKQDIPKDLILILFKNILKLKWNEKIFFFTFDKVGLNIENDNYHYALILANLKEDT